MGLILVSAPTAEPIHLIEAKLHLRVSVSDDDVLIGSMESAARQYGEDFTRKQLVAARWKQVLDEFGSDNNGSMILLDRSPVLQVVSIQYIDIDGVTQTVDPATYIVDSSTGSPRITPVFGQIWPIPRPQIASVWVNFDAGYATTITANTAANTITPARWPALNVGDAVRFTNSGGALPAPLVSATDYYIQSIPSAGVYTLAATSGGAVIPITTAGTGTSFLGEVPEGMRSWIKLRMGALYENREEVVVATRITVAELPFLDRMLDFFKTFRF